MPDLRVRDYSLVLPPGFVLVHLRGDLKENLRRVLNEKYGSQLNDRERGRLAQVRRSLLPVLQRARARGVVDAVLPLGTPWDAPVSLSLMFTPARADDRPADGAGATAVTTRAGSAQREVVEPEGAAPLPLDPSLSDGPVGTVLRTVHHVWPMPTEGVDYLVGTFSVSGSSDPELAPMVDALTELGDTIMSSLAWRDAHGQRVRVPGATGVVANEEKEPVA